MGAVGFRADGSARSQAEMVEGARDVDSGAELADKTYVMS